MYLALAALPLFGLGQFLMRGDPQTWGGAQKYLALYLFSSLSLLVTTSFLGLRRYLRQRQVEMPGDVTIAWLVGGLVIIASILGIAYLAPVPGRMLSSLELPAFLDSPQSLEASKYGWGDEAAEKTSPGAATTPNEDDQEGKDIESVRPQEGRRPETRATARATKAPPENSLVVRSPAEKSPAVKSLAEKSLAVKSLAVKSLAVKSLAVKSPAVKSPLVRSPLVRSPAVKSPAVKSPLVRSLAVKSPAVKSPLVRSLAVKSPAVKSPLVKRRAMTRSSNSLRSKATSKTPLQRRANLTKKDLRKPLIESRNLNARMHRKPARMLSNPSNNRPLAATRRPRAERANRNRVLGKRLPRRFRPSQAFSATWSCSCCSSSWQPFCGSTAMRSRGGGGNCSVASRPIRRTNGNNSNYSRNPVHRRDRFHPSAIRSGRRMTLAGLS